MLRPIHRHFNFLSYYLILLLIIELTLFIWVLNRGFDFSDEAFGFLGLRNPEGIHHAGTYYAVLFNRFFGWVNITIVNVRIIRLVLLLATGSAFASGLIAWLGRKSQLDQTQKLNLFVFIILASLLINANGSQSLTYNIASTYLLQCIVGMVLYVFQREYQINKVDIFFYGFTGALLFALFAVKAPSSILLTGAVWLALVIDKRNIRATLLYSGVMFAGALVMAVLVFRGSLISWLIDYYETLTILGDTTGSSSFSRYADDVEYVTTSLLIAHSTILLATVALLLIDSRLQNKILRIISAILFTGLFAYVSYDKSFYLGGVKYYYTINFLTIMALFVLFTSRAVLLVIDLFQHKRMNLPGFVMALFLFAIPFVGAVGTGNLLSIQIIWYTSFLYGAIYLLLYLYGPYYLSFFMVFLSLNAMAQSISGLIYYPYRINSLIEETQPLSSKIGAENILVNASLKQSVDSAYNILHAKARFVEGDPIFAFSPEYGLIYLMRGTLPGWTWYNEKPTRINLVTLKDVQLNNMDRMIFILPSDYELDSAYRACFKERKIDFTDGYSSVGIIPYFIDNRSRPLTVYAPNNRISP